MIQSPRIINVQQNVAVQAPPKKTGGGGGRPRSPPRPRRPRSPPTIRTDLTQWEKFVRKVVLAAIAFIILLILVGIITSRFNKERKICNTEGTFTLNEGQTLILSPPVHATCRVPNGSKTEPGCFIYDDNKNCSLKIKSRYQNYNQITYQLHFLDVNTNCGDYLSIQGHDEQMCSQISTAQNEVKTMQNEIEIFWFTDSINNTDNEGFTLWIWEETANE